MVVLRRRTLLIILSAAGLLYWKVHIRKEIGPSRVKRTNVNPAFLGFAADADSLVVPQAGIIPEDTWPRANDRFADWLNGSLPRTNVLKHFAGQSESNALVNESSHLSSLGFTLLENAYSYNGTLYLVSDHISEFPLVRDIVSSGHSEEKVSASENLDYLDSVMRVMSRKEAIAKIGGAVNNVAGVTVRDLAIVGVSS